MSQFNAKERREDYALQVVPNSFRQWSWISLFSVMLGIATAMFFLAWGGDLVRTYGTANVIIGMIVSTLFIGSVGFILATIASETGLDMDLITSGAGLGYKGAGLTSLLYAFSTFIYFAMEGAIIASAIHTQFPILPLWFLYIGIGVIFIPLVWYGLTTLNWIMWVTLPACVALLYWAISIAKHLPNSVSFLTFMPVQTINLAAGPALLQLLATSLPLLGCAIAAADIGRFIPKEQRKISTIAMSYVLSGISFLGTTLLGAWLSVKLKETNPGVYFPLLLGGWGTAFVLLTQIRINLINAYGGSLALTTFFSRIFNFAPGRHWWIILTIIISVLLMFGNILEHLLEVLTFQAVFIVAWLMTVVSYLLFNTNIFKITAENFAFQKGTIPNYNPIGLSALALSLVVAVPMAFGIFGTLGKTLAPFVAAVLAFVTVPVVGFVLKYRHGLKDDSKIR